MSEKQEGKSRLFSRRFLLRYCAVFAVLAVLLLGPLVFRGKSLVWTADGRSQYYVYLHYMGNTLRDFFTGLLHGRLSLPMYDFAIGLGDDAGTVLRMHLLDLLSVFVPGRYTEYLYDFLIVLRLFLAGLAFSAYGLYRRWKPFYVLTGAALYLSCGYVVKVGIANPTFLSAMILLPVLLLCADRVLRGERCLLFIVVTAAGFINNYYFMYQCSIALAVFVLFRLPAALEGRSGKNALSAAVRRILFLAFCYLCGAAISMVFFLPVVLRLFESARLTDAYAGSLLSYGTAWLKNTAVDLFAPHLSAGSNSHLNFAAPALPAVILLFTLRDEKRRDLLALRASLVLEAAALLVPAAGLLMNGMGGVSNRWTFIIAFSLACALAACGSRWEAPRPLHLVLTAVCIGAYAGIMVSLAPTGEKRTFLLMGLALLAACFLWMVLMYAASRHASGTGASAPCSGKPAGGPAGVLRFGLPACVLVCAFLFARASFGPADSTHFYGTASYSDAGSLYSFYTGSRYAVLADLRDGSFWRADTSFMTTGEENASLLLGYHGTSMYNSILNTAVIDSLRDLDSIGINAVHRLFSMDGRTACEAMACVRYFLTLAGEEETVPAGFVKREDLTRGDLLVYENTQPLPFGYAVDSYVPAQTFEGLSALEKQQIMLQGAVLSEEGPEADGQDTDADAAAVLKEVAACDAEITKQKAVLPEGGDGTELTDRGVKVKENGGSFEVEMPLKKGCECYVYFRGLYRDKDYSFVRLDTPGLTKTITLRSTDGTYSLHRKNYLVCLGTSVEDGTQTLKVSFPEKGGYRLKGMTFYYVPAEQTLEKIRDLSGHPLEDVSITGGTVTGTIRLEEDRLLVLSIPWRKGWKAAVDGEETALRRVNGMYTGLLLPPGEHSVKLVYTAPGITAGAFISAAGLLVLAALFAAGSRKRRDSNQNG